MWRKNSAAAMLKDLLILDNEKDQFLNEGAECEMF